jgi:hypothetical protein
VRRALLEVLDALPPARRHAEEPAEDGGFQFLAATSVPSPIGVRVSRGDALVDALVEADPSVWFWHLIETPWREERPAPILAWLESRGESRLAAWLAAAATSGLPIDAARAQLARRQRRSTIARRLTDATRAAEDVRREAGREAVARFVRRARGTAGRK